MLAVLPTVLPLLAFMTLGIRALGLTVLPLRLLALCQLLAQLGGVAYVPCKQHAMDAADSNIGEHNPDLESKVHNFACILMFLHTDRLAPRSRHQCGFASKAGAPEVEPVELRGVRLVREADLVPTSWH